MQRRPRFRKLFSPGPRPGGSRFASCWICLGLLVSVAIASALPSGFGVGSRQSASTGDDAQLCQEEGVAPCSVADRQAAKPVAAKGEDPRRVGATEFSVFVSTSALSEAPFSRHLASRGLLSADRAPTLIDLQVRLQI